MQGRFSKSLAGLVLGVVLAVSGTSALARTVQVDARQNSVSGGNGLNTGVVVNKGQLLTITVDRRDFWFAAANDPTRRSNADGLGNPFGNNFGNFTLGDFSFLFGTLVGSLDNGQTFFQVGTRLEIIVQKSGTLRLYYWDSNSADNSGAVRALIQTYNPTSN